MKPSTETRYMHKHILYLQRYKETFLCCGIIEYLIQILAGPFSREGATRTSNDYLIMELILTLFRNLLVIPNEKLKSTRSAMSGSVYLQVYIFSS